MKGQRFFSLVPVLLLLFILLGPASAESPKDPLRPIRQLANQIYKSAQDMVVHGAEGHLGEIVEFGTKVIERSEALLEAIESSDSSPLKKKKTKLSASIKGTLAMAKRAVAFSEENNLRLAMAAARKTSFRAKQTRQRLHMLR